MLPRVKYLKALYFKVLQFAFNIRNPSAGTVISTKKYYHHKSEKEPVYAQFKFSGIHRAPEN
jgi:hypothetical protein